MTKKSPKSWFLPFFNKNDQKIVNFNDFWPFLTPDHLSTNASIGLLIASRPGPFLAENGQKWPKNPQKWPFLDEKSILLTPLFRRNFGHFWPLFDPSKMVKNPIFQAKNGQNDDFDQFWPPPGHLQSTPGLPLPPLLPIWTTSTWSLPSPFLALFDPLASPDGPVRPSKNSKKRQKIEKMAIFTKITIFSWKNMKFLCSIFWHQKIVKIVKNRKNHDFFMILTIFRRFSRFSAKIASQNLLRTRSDP